MLDCRFDTSTIKNQQSAIINQRSFRIIGILLGGLRLGGGAPLLHVLMHASG
jgi:hypothetical protein